MVERLQSVELMVTPEDGFVISRPFCESMCDSNYDNVKRSTRDRLLRNPQGHVRKRINPFLVQAVA